VEFPASRASEVVVAGRPWVARDGRALPTVSTSSEEGQALLVVRSRCSTSAMNSSTPRSELLGALTAERIAALGPQFGLHVRQQAAGPVVRPAWVVRAGGLDVASTSNAAPPVSCPERRMVSTSPVGICRTRSAVMRALRW
jgi:hypothetical protein